MGNRSRGAGWVEEENGIEGVSVEEGIEEGGGVEEERGRGGEG